MKPKVFVLDTNVLMNNPRALQMFGNADVIIPLSVLRELDKNKKGRDEAARNARATVRALDKLRSQGSLEKGVPSHGGGTISVRNVGKQSLERLPQEMREDSTLRMGDVALIAMMLDLRHRFKRKEFILVTDDINLRVQCDSLKVSTEGLRAGKAKPSREGLYGGVARIDVSHADIENLYRQTRLSAKGMDIDLRSNQFVVMKANGSGGSAIGRFDSTTNSIDLVRAPTEVFGLKPRNKEQGFALDLLLDERISLVTLTGIAGTGKTLLALAAGCQQIFTGHLYERMIVIKPIQTVGKDIGYLPGTLDEKLEPWVVPIKDNLSFLFREPPNDKKGGNGKGAKNGRKKRTTEYLSLVLEEGKIEIEALAYIRGRSIPNTYILIDEAQNLSLHELKTIITRAGENTKIVLTGDLDQIDHPQLDIFTNGLTHAVERFRDESCAGHVSLIKGERSALASLASKIL